MSEGRQRGKAQVNGCGEKCSVTTGLRFWPNHHRATRPQAKREARMEGDKKGTVCE